MVDRRKPASSKPAPQRKLAGESLAFRSRITNGSALLEHVDGRSSWARRFRDIICAYTADMGGEDHLSEGQRAIIRRAALLQVELEFQEARLAQMHEAGDVPGARRIQDYQQTAGALRRLIESLGLHEGRRARDITPPGRAPIDGTAAALRAMEAAT